MKRYLLILIAFSASMLMVVGCGEEETSPQATIPIEQTYMAAMIDVEQIIEKSGLNPMRPLIADQLAKEINNEDAAAYMRSVVMDLNKTGIDFNSPILCVVEPSNDDGGMYAYFIAKVANIKDLNFLVEIYDKSMGGETYQKGDIHYIDMSSNGYICGYDSKHIVIATMRPHTDSDEMVKCLLDKPSYDLSLLENNDMALYVNLGKMIEDIHKMPMLQEDTKAMYIALDDICEEDASALYAINFEAGKATMTIDTKGIQNLDGRTNPYTGKHLEMLPSNTLAVASSRIDGAFISKFVEQVMEYPAFADEFGANRNDINTAKNIITGALLSINGDMTIALTEIDGNVNTSIEYDAYWDEYRTSSYPQLSNIEAIALIDVKDDYILDNILQFGGNYLENISDDNYYINFQGEEAYLGQQGDLFYFGVNTTPQKENHSLAQARWIGDVKDSAAYLVLDIDNFMRNSFFNELLTYAFEEEFGDQEYEILYDILKKSDYASATVNEQGTHAQITWVMKDKHTNALQQVITPILTHTQF